MKNTPRRGELICIANNFKSKFMNIQETICTVCKTMLSNNDFLKSFSPFVEMHFSTEDLFVEIRDRRRS